jgi:tRNA G18 (ribose-2'-O)-methylase SpoU
MTNGLKEVIKGLEKQKTAIERALAALREVDGTAVESAPLAAAPARRGRPKRKGGMTAEGRKRLSEALKKRWAVKRAASQVKPLSFVKTQAKAKAKKKGGMTPEGRKRLSEALKKRWAVKRAAAKK